MHLYIYIIYIYISDISFVAAVSDERAQMTLAAASVDVDDIVTDPSNGDCAAVSFRPAAASAATSSSTSHPSPLVRSTSGGDSAERQAAVAALCSNDTQRSGVEVTSAPASSAADEEERELCTAYSYHALLIPCL